MDKKTKFTNPTIKKILKHYRTIYALEYLNAVADWDLDTYMPEKGAKARGEAMGKAETLTQKIFLEKHFVELIKKSQELDDLNDYEKGVARVLNRDLDYFEKLPPEFIEEFAKTTAVASTVWKKAKKDNKFKDFEPYLIKLVELVKKKADYMGFDEHPYDALIDSYEEDWTTKDYTEYFDKVRNPLKELLGKIQKKGSFTQDLVLEKTPYDEDKMVELNKKVLKYLNADYARFRDDQTVHPFTTGFCVDDVRIATYYPEGNFGQSLAATAHEFGHALHRLNCDPELDFTPLTEGDSYTLNESQSRFMENIVGRSKEFLGLFVEDMKGLSPEIAKIINKDGIDGIYRYINAVKPSLIRVEADEVTYHFHIMLRFEIEKGLIEGSLAVKDLPEIWNSKMKEYLGVVPPTDSEGVLQDTHWSWGYFGYFPTYSSGSFLAAMWKVKMEEDLGKIEKLVHSSAGIDKVENWLKDNVQQYGAVYTLKDLLKKSLGKSFDPQPMLDYLEVKYLG